MMGQDTLLLPHGMTLVFTNDREIGTVSDSFHTFNELYAHRCLLFCWAIRHDASAWKSKLHNDGTQVEGWFIAGTTVLCLVNDHSEFQPITYHLPLDMWDMCHAKEVSKAPPWDGHTSLDVCKRLAASLQKE